MEKTVEGNKLIAEFMGFEGQHEDWCGNNILEIDELMVPQLRHYKPNERWDDLMPVVEKIQSIEITPPPNYRGYRIEIVVQGYVEITGFPMPKISKNVSIEGSLINAVWQAVVQFINWFNSVQKAQASVANG